MTKQQHSAKERYTLQTGFDPAEWDSGMFVLRTPLAPLAGREESASPSQALLGDFGCARGIQDAVIQEALWLASPGFHSRLQLSQEKPAGDRSQQKFQSSLWRYKSRLSSRPTPFGLFAGVSTGKEAQLTNIRLAPTESYRRRTRLDMGTVLRLADTIVADDSTRRSLRWYPNDSILAHVDRLHFAEGHLQRGRCEYVLASVEWSEYLQAALNSAKRGATIDELVEAIIGLDEELERTEVLEYLDDLVDSGVLVSDGQPSVTGDDPLEQLLRRVPESHPAMTVLAETQNQMTRWDSLGPGIATSEYESATRSIAELLPGKDPGQPFQVDLFKPLTCSELGSAVVGEFLRAATSLQTVAPPQTEIGLADYCRKFVEAYGDEEVPLKQALDPEAGIGFLDTDAASMEPLCEGLERTSSGEPEVAEYGPHSAWLFQLIEQSTSEGLHEIDLECAPLPPMSGRVRTRLPDSFAVFGAVAAPSQEAVNKGRFQVLLKAVNGPSSARLLGRFSNLDGELEAGISRHLREEETHQPDAIFAEIVHLPEGRLGNVLLRPVLRKHEIPYLGRSGADPSKQISTDDLLISVKAGTFVLKSRSLNRQVIPRLATAHNYGSPANLPLYRFLCMLQQQDLAFSRIWTWGPFYRARFLPRIRLGRVVFARAQWRVDQQEIVALQKLTTPEGLREVRSWRERRGIPRYTYLVDGENELLLDLDDHVSLEAFVEAVKRFDQCFICEMFPGPDDLWIQGPGGRFANEFIVPFVRRGPRQEPTTVSRESVTPPEKRVRRRIPPGGDWLYLKLYCGISSADGVLVDTLAPLCSRLVKEGLIERFFFLRYCDPDWHVRVRFHGEPDTLAKTVLPLLCEAGKAEIETGRCLRFLFDTYVREIDRYGGSQAISLAESFFAADSRACLSILPSLLDDGDARWQAVLAGIHVLMDDLGLTTVERAAVVRSMRDGLQSDLGFSKDSKKAVAAGYRRHRDLIRHLIEDELQRENSVIGMVLRQRSRETKGVTRELRLLAQDGHLSRPITDIAGSLAHMHANRLLRAKHNQQEAVIYHYLLQTYMAQISANKYKAAEGS